VTLISHSFWSTLTDPHPSTSNKVWGVAYRIKSSKVAEVRDYLDIREINGYTIHYTPFYPADSSETINTLVYIGTPDNDQFIGPQEPQALAEHIYRSVGPSGPNKEYLFCLEDALDGLSEKSGDGHVKDLAGRVRDIELSVTGVEIGSQVTGEAVQSEVRRATVQVTNEQEETEH
jgi:cation transport protein ChaC